MPDNILLHSSSREQSSASEASDLHATIFMQSASRQDHEILKVNTEQYHAEDTEEKKEDEVENSEVADDRQRLRQGFQDEVEAL